METQTTYESSPITSPKTFSNRDVEIETQPEDETHSQEYSDARKLSEMVKEFLAEMSLCVTLLAKIYVW